MAWPGDGGLVDVVVHTVEFSQTNVIDIDLHISGGTHACIT